MTVDAQTVVIILVVGLIAGWLASFVVGGAGAVRYLVTGILGAIVGSSTWVFCFQLFFCL